MDTLLNELLPKLWDLGLYLCENLGKLWEWMFKDFKISFGALDSVIDFLPLDAKPIYLMGGLAIVVALFKNIFL